MKASLKSIHSPDADLLSYSPDDRSDFCIFVQVMVGCEGEDGAESFNVTVCSPKWLVKNCTSTMIRRGYLLMNEYNYQALWGSISSYCDSCIADDWTGLAVKLSHLGKWEFEDYKR